MNGAAICCPPAPHESAEAGTNAVRIWLIVIAAAALLIRLPSFGNPIYHIDDQFYLLVGREILNGGLPYVDVWDRKPLGLFLIYAAIAALGGSGVLATHLVALVFTAATAMALFAVARRFTTVRGAGLAALVYLAALEPVGGGGGQSPVFYNLLMVGAAGLLLRAWDQRDTSRFQPLLCGAMLLAGLAVFIKTSAVVEACFFGLFAVALVRARTGSWTTAVRWSLVHALIGVFPTAAGAAFYALIGHWDAFWFATVVSVLEKAPLDAPEIGRGITFLLICLFPLLLCAAAGIARSADQGLPGAVERRLLFGWLIAALLGLVAIPNFFDHYSLPLLLPLCIAAAILFGRTDRGIVWAALPFSWTLSMAGFPALERTAAASSEFAALVETVEAGRDGGCLYVHEGPVRLYTATDACRLTRFLFPDHLNSELEARAIGTDPVGELRRVLALRPAVIVTGRRMAFAPNRRGEAILRQELRRHYRLVRTMSVRVTHTGQRLQVWALGEDLNPPSRRPPARFEPGAATDRRPR